MALPDIRRQIQPPTKRLDDEALDRLARMRAAREAQMPAPTPTTAPTPTPTTAKGEAADSMIRAAQPGVKVPPSADRLRDQVPTAGKKDDDDLAYLARLRATQEKEREAAKAEREASKAQQIQSTRAKAGAAGLGLSGAAAGQEATVRRQADRTNNLADADMEKRFRDEEFDAYGRAGAVMDYEDAYDVDIDGDGKVNGRDVSSDDGVGDGNPDNDTGEAPTGADAERQKLTEVNEVLDAEDYSWWDTDTQPGSVEEPYRYGGTKAGLEQRIREQAPGALPLVRKVMSRGPGAGEIVIWVDQYGNHYTIVADATPSRREQEVSR